MTRYVAVALSSPRPGMEDEFNDWYDEQHLSEVLASGIVDAARRFRSSDRSGDPATAQRYMTIYEFETDDLRDAKKRIMGEQTPEQRETVSLLVEPDSVEVRFYELITDRSGR